MSTLQIEAGFYNMAWLSLLVLPFMVLPFLFMGKGKRTPEEAPKKLEAPSIEVGVSIPVLFGSRMIESPSIAWWGDVEIIKTPLPGKGKKG